MVSMRGCSGWPDRTACAGRHILGCVVAEVPAMSESLVIRRSDDGWRVEPLDGIDGDEAWFATLDEALAWCRELGLDPEIDETAPRAGARDLAPDVVRQPSADPRGRR